VGLISGLLTLPLAPVRGTIWLAEQLAETADNELYDEKRILRELMDLEMQEAEGAIDAGERLMREDDLLERLSIARQRNAAPGRRDGVSRG
jgi:gas vesicle protein GvpG